MVKRRKSTWDLIMDESAYVYIDNRGIRYEFDKSFKLRRASDYDTYDDIDIKQ